MLPLNCINPIFRWLYDDDHVKRTVILIGSLSIITGIILCCFEAGEYTISSKIGHFLLYTFVWSIQWALIIPLAIGFVLSIVSFVLHLIGEYL